MRGEVVAGRSATIAVQLYDDETRVASSTPVTVEVERADGTVVVAAGTATTSPTGSVGRYEIALTPAQLPDVDMLTATWSVTLDGQAQTRQTTIEVSGGRYFELAELRAMPGLSDPARFPTTKLAEARIAAQDELDRQVGAAFVERYGTLTLDGTGCGTITLRRWARRILGGSVAGVALSDEAVALMDVYPSGLVVRSVGSFGLGSGLRDVVLRYTHGWPEDVPSDIHDAALELARHHLLGWRSFLPDEPVEADDLGRETAAGESFDRQRGQDQINSTIKLWRRRLGIGGFASVALA